MGTFRARFTLFSTSGNVFSTNGSGIDAYHFYQNAIKSGTIVYSLIGNCFFLDGSLVGIAFSGLPSGFTLSGAQALSTPSLVFSDTTVIAARGAAAPAKSTIELTFGSYTKNIAFPTSQLQVSDLAFTKILDLTTNFLDIEGDTLSASASLVQIIDTIDITGNYVIVTYPISPTVQNSSTPIGVGDKVKISAPNGLDGVQQVQISYTDPVKGAITIIVSTFYWILQNSTQFWFYLPIDLGTFAGSISINLIGNGVQFSGSVPAGTLTVIYSDASGIYQLTPGQTNDILYSRKGYTTINKQLMLQNMLDDEIYEDDFFDLLGYPQQILSQTDINEDWDISDFTEVGVTQFLTLPSSVEIPSPFIKTAFLP